MCLGARVPLYMWGRQEDAGGSGSARPGSASNPSSAPEAPFVAVSRLTMRLGGAGLACSTWGGGDGIGDLGPSSYGGDCPVRFCV